MMKNVPTTGPLKSKSPSLPPQREITPQPLKPGNGSTEEENGPATMNPRVILRALLAVREGDFSVRRPADQAGMKSEFLANMSHQLRTPLNSILILGQQFLDNPQGHPSAKQVELAKTIHNPGTDLLNLISDILDLSKIESGTVTIEAGEVSFASLRDTVERNFRHVADARTIGFVVNLDTHLARQIITDAKRLLQILNNLLSNAFKFTSQGKVTFAMRTAQQGWSPDHPVLKRARAAVAFEVSDTGIGIPAEKQKIIFEAFQRADARTSRKFGGTGLGLAISRELANLLGGEIKLASAQGQGSTFALFLPLTRAGPAVAAVGAEAHLPAMKVLPTPTTLPKEKQQMIERLRQTDEALCGKKVLVVDDDVRNIFALTGLLERHTMQVVSASNGRAAVSLVEQTPDISLVLMDIMMPEMDGYETMKVIRNNPRHKLLPMIALTAKAMKGDREKCLEAGASDYIAKPVNSDQLVSLMRVWLHR